MALDLWIPGDAPEPLPVTLPDGVEAHRLPRRRDMPSALGRADMLVAPFSRDTVVAALERLDGVRVVQALSAGVDWLLPVVPAGVTLCDGAGVHDVAVAEWALMAILACRRRLPRHVADQAQARWSRSAADDVADLEGATVVVVGHGSIGRALETRLRACGAEVVGVASAPRPGVHGPDAIPDLLPRADVVVLLVPLTEATRRMVDAGFLARMRPGALLVNAARGAIVDMGALTAAVESGHIQAALDVTDPEPLPPEHPLWRLPGALITPHVAGTVTGFPARAWRLVAEQAGRLMRGQELRNVVVAGY